MPKFTVTIMHRVEEYASLEVSAKDAEAAEAKVEALTESKTWEELSAKVDINQEIDEVVIDQVEEA